ncbi:MAG: hypothetical protein Q9217_006831, partial [Psora testacea]
KLDALTPPQTQRVYNRTPSSTQSYHTLPLTRENLGLVTGAMPRQPLPTPSTATKSQQTNPTQGIAIEDILKYSGIVKEDETARATHGFMQLSASTDRILRQARHSPDIGGESEEDWKSLHKIYTVQRNERTFRDQFYKPFTGLHHIIKDGNLRWSMRKWAQDGLDINSDQRFLTGSLPKVNTKSIPEWEKRLNSLPRVKNPEPDYTYAYDVDAFSEPEKAICNQYHKWSGISQGIRFPGVLVEIKKDGVAAVKAQVARAGAAVVHANREMVEASRKNIYQPGIDLDTFVYSFAITFHYAELNIHWAEVLPNRHIKFHMHCIKVYTFHPLTDGIFEQRRDLNNLLEWMLSDRLSCIRSLLRDIDRAGSPTVVPILPMQDLDEEDDEAGHRQDEDNKEEEENEDEDELSYDHGPPVKRKR